MSQRAADRWFVRILHLAVHFGLIVLLWSLLRDTIRQFQEHDQTLRSLIGGSSPDKCVNYSAVVEDIIAQSRCLINV